MQLALLLCVAKGGVQGEAMVSAFKRRVAQRKQPERSQDALRTSAAWEIACFTETFVDTDTPEDEDSCVTQEADCCKAQRSWQKRGHSWEIECL